ncbi:MAG TPA: hypothetical protein VF397_00390, partial [Pyrinomonadaceae bacterium]
SRSISNGVVLGAAGWQQALENNKQAYALAFVGRPEFQTAFPGTMTAAQFVDKLDANAGLVLSSTDRTTLIAMLDVPSDAAKRAAVVRAFAENSNLQQREFNKAFVLMQYFGYLRRNPNDAPELNRNFDGFNFWLAKLNQFSGDFVAAEMVKAFTTSSEYRSRFGP